MVIISSPFKENGLQDKFPSWVSKPPKTKETCLGEILNSLKSSSSWI
jgi:hypothetical protein